MLTAGLKLGLQAELWQRHRVADIDQTNQSGRQLRLTGKGKTAGVALGSLQTAGGGGLVGAPAARAIRPAVTSRAKALRMVRCNAD